MYFKIQIDWNKFIVLDMNKNTAESIDAVFGDPNNVWKMEYEREIGQGLIKSQDSRTSITVMRTDEFRDLVSNGQRIETFWKNETTQEAA